MKNAPSSLPAALHLEDRAEPVGDFERIVRRVERIPSEARRVIGIEDQKIALAADAPHQRRDLVLEIPFRVEDQPGRRQGRRRGRGDQSVQQGVEHADRLAASRLTEDHQVLVEIRPLPIEPAGPKALVAEHRHRCFHRQAPIGLGVGRGPARVAHGLDLLAQLMAQVQHLKELPAAQDRNGDQSDQTEKPAPLPDRRQGPEQIEGRPGAQHIERNKPDRRHGESRRAG